MSGVVLAVGWCAVEGAVFDVQAAMYVMSAVQHAGQFNMLTTATSACW